jgi:hypothetical protein
VRLKTYLVVKSDGTLLATSEPEEGSEVLDITLAKFSNKHCEKVDERRRILEGAECLQDG